MPFTPFHFGPGGLLHVAAPRRVGFLAFCAANVALDLEPLYMRVVDRHPHHAGLHTYLAATILVALLVLVVAIARRAVPAWADRLPPWPIGVGFALGAWSHVLLDSIMHTDVHPWEPWSVANPMYGAVGLRPLHAFCVAAGALAFFVWAVRRSQRDA